MSDRTNGSNTSLPVIPRADLDNEQSSVEIRKKDHARLTRLIKLLKKTDELDSHIYDIVHNIVDGEFCPDTPPYDHDDIAEIIQTIFHLEDVMYPAFLRKVAFPYRMLRLSLSLYDMNPISDHQILTVQMSDAEKRNHALNQLIWFQFLVGATAAQVEDNLIAYRRAKSDASASFSPRNTPPRDLPTMEDKITPPQHPRCSSSIPSPRTV